MGAFSDLQGSQGLTDKVHTVAGDIVTGDGYELPASIEDVSRLLPVWVGAWCGSHNVPDLIKSPPLVFRALCRDIGQAIKASKILLDTTPRPTAGNYGRGGGTCGAYDPRKVMALFDVFTRLCDEYNKPPFESTFAAFCGVSLAYIKEYVDGLTSKGFNVHQMTHGAELDAIRQTMTQDPVGRIAIMNNEAWNASGAIDDKRVESVASLPKFGAVE